MTLGCIATLQSSDDNNSNASLLKGGIVFECYTSQDTSCMNASINFLNVGNSTICTEANSCDIVSISVINKTVDNYFTHKLNGP